MSVRVHVVRRSPALDVRALTLDKFSEVFPKTPSADAEPDICEGPRPFQCCCQVVTEGVDVYGGVLIELLAHCFNAGPTSRLFHPLG